MTMRARILLVLLLAAATAWFSAGGREGSLRADTESPFVDSDLDFLPDALEWALLTNPHRSDSDNDGTSDFLEVVQRGMPQQANPPAPADHEMRIVLSSFRNANGQDITMMNLLFRFLGGVQLMTSFQPWIQIPQLPGVLLPLDSLTNSVVSIVQRVEPGEGLWVRVSMTMADESLLRNLLPCTIGADAIIGGRQIRSGLAVLEVSGVVASLVRFDSERFALQSIGASNPITGGEPNKICVIGLEDRGSSPGGSVVYVVVEAACQPMNDFECGSGCPQNLGFTINIPGGIGSITGG
jgi:hypothetical protein